MSLRRFLWVGLFFLFFSGCLMAATLWYSTREATSIVNQLTDSVESADVAHVVQRNLSAHRRLLLSTRFSDPTERKMQLKKATEELIRSSDHLTDFISTATEKSDVEMVQQRVVSYLKNYDAMEAKGLDSRELYQSVSDKFDETQEAIENLMRFNLDEALALQSQSARQNAVNDALLGVSMLLFAMVLIVLLLGLKNYLFKPILELERTIEKYELGMSADSKAMTGAAEITSIAESFNRMSSRLSKQREMQLMFVSSVAHDLRNPMSAISMAADIVSEDIELAGKNKDLLQMIKRQSNHLNRLVNDLLDTTRIQSGHLELSLSVCDLRALLHDAVLLHSSLSPIHKIVLQVPDEPVFVACDRDRLAQVLNNLFSNAIKYSPLGGSIAVLLKKERDSVFLSVADEGVGIPSEEIDSIFVPFRRSSHSKNAIPGVGLGLSAAKKIINAHQGGEIFVKSELNQGTEVTIKLKSVSDPQPSFTEANVL